MSRSRPLLRLLHWLRSNWLLVFVYLGLLGAALAFGWMIPNPGATTSAAATPGPSLAPTPSPGIEQTVSGQVGAINNAHIAFLLALATLLVIPGAVILFGVALVRVCQLLTRRQLVITDIVDATGLGWKDQIQALSQTVREGFFQAADDYGARGEPLRPRNALSTSKPQRPSLMPQRTMPAPNPASVNGLATLAEGLKGAAPTPVAALLVALAALVPPSGIKVDACLAQDPGSRPRLRLEVRIADLGDGSKLVMESVVGRTPGRSKTVSDDATEFATEAGRWLAIRVSRWQQIPPGSPTEPDGRTDQARAEAHLVIGAELLRLAGSAKALDRVSLYEAAVEEFTQAEKWYPDWYVAIESLAGATSYLGMAQRSSSLEWDAVKLYERAQRLAKPDPLAPPDPLDQSAEPRIGLACGVAQLRTGDDKQQKIAEGDFDELHPATALYDGRGFDVLYTAACWRVTHAKVAPEQFAVDLTSAAKYLALALARNPRVAAWARVDPDFGDIRPMVCNLADAAIWMTLSPSEKELLRLDGDLFAGHATTVEDDLSRPAGDLAQLETRDLAQLEQSFLQPAKVLSEQAKDLFRHLKETMDFARDTASDWIRKRSTTASC